MTPSSTRRNAAVTLAVSGLAMVGALIPAATGHAATHKPATHQAAARAAAVKPVTVGSTYLALGDSVSFGYREPNAIPAPNYSKAKSFVGFPEVVADDLGLKLVNAACSGETSASFLKTSAASNGCENTYNPTTKTQDPGGYRTQHPLHVRYASKTQSQLAFAEKYLKGHKKTRLVSLMIGANDLFLCQVNTADNCNNLDEVNATVAKVQANVTKMLKGLRKTAKYTGQIVLVEYYSTNYTDPLVSGAVEDLNTHLKSAAAGYKVTFANAFSTFQNAAKQDGGNTCTARLLTVLSTTPSSCGVHPSIQGADVLATTVMHVVKKK
jgi:lysophospholipase L1-like esterase